MDEQAEHTLDMEDGVFADRRMIGIDRIAAPSRTHRQHKPDFPFQPFDPPGQFRPGQPPRSAAVERFGQAGFSRGRREHGFEDVAVVAVAAVDRKRPVRRQAEPAAAIRVEQAVEQRRGIEVRHAPPVDRPVAPGQHHRPPVAKRAIAGEREIAVLAHMCRIGGRGTQALDQPGQHAEGRRFRRV